MARWKGAWKGLVGNGKTWFRLWGLGFADEGDSDVFVEWTSLLSSAPSSCSSVSSEAVVFSDGFLCSTALYSTVAIAAGVSSILPR